MHMKRASVKVFLHFDINIIMIYLVPNANCVFLNNNANLFKGAKYTLNDERLPAAVFLANNCFPLTLNLYEICAGLVPGSFSTNICQNACCVNGDVFVFLQFVPICNFAYYTFKFKNKEVQISLGTRLVISLDGTPLVDSENRGLNYSRHETFGDFCFVYFEGEGNFVAILKNDELIFADYYDKAEIASNEFYFLTRLRDSINHGRVCHISGKESETYLVYLDEYDLNLKSEFLPHVFLDCLLAKNYKYCNALLRDELKQKTEADIANFFCAFDGFYPLDNFTFAAIKKDAVVGIYKFEVENDKISNIAELITAKN